MRKTTIVAVIMAIFASCGAVSAQEQHLIMTTITLPNTPASQTYHEWADRINAQGKGIVNIDVRDGFALVNSQNFYERLLADVFQISFGSLNYQVAKFRLSQVMALPFILNSSEQASVVYWRLYKSGLLDSEFDQIVPLFVQAFPQVSLHLTKSPTAPLVDLKGLRIIASGQTATRVVTTLGASPLSISLSESYEALQRGTADGISFPMAPLHDFKLDEVTHYHVLAALGGGPGGVWMSKAKYLGLSPQVRKILEDNSGEAASRRAGQNLDKLQAEVPKNLETQKNQTVMELTPEQTKLWESDLAPVVETWVSADKERASAVLAKVHELVADYQNGK